jgi:L-histidine Nalpha-methyltransferase
MSTRLLPPAPAATRHEFLRDVLAGLGRAEKTLPCKYFYDRRGSELFDRICELDEYYHARCELAILREHTDEIAALFGPAPALIEYGSGSSLKTRLLLDRMAGGAYLPVDISGDHLLHAAACLARDYPHIGVIPVVADFSRPFAIPPVTGRRVVYFSGSTISNFAPDEAARLLGQIARQVGPGGGLLIGVDLKKDRSVLEPAYDDPRGVTAEFNLNLLARINRELGADFDLSAFRHRAVWNEGAGRIEMYLVSQRDQTVHLAGHTLPFRGGEAICTEHSYKFSLEEMADLAGRAGLAVRRVWTDDHRLFSVQYAEAVS